MFTHIFVLITCRLINYKILLIGSIKWIELCKTCYLLSHVRKLLFIKAQKREGVTKSGRKTLWYLCEKKCLQLTIKMTSCKMIRYLNYHSKHSQRHSQKRMFKLRIIFETFYQFCQFLLNIIWVSWQFRIICVGTRLENRYYK